MKRSITQRVAACCSSAPTKCVSRDSILRQTRHSFTRPFSSTQSQQFLASRPRYAPDASSSKSTSFPSPIPEQRRSLSEGLSDSLPDPSELADPNSETRDWTRSFHGLSSTPFSPEQADILMQPIDSEDIEIKPDGILYLPEIKYRRILNRAFGPGGWGLAPRGETVVTEKIVTREYGLVCAGRLVSVARGEQQYFDPDGIPTATEGCKSNALMRCCKDLGVASELWDPRFIRKFMASSARELMVEHTVTKKRRKHYMRKDDELRYPWKEVAVLGGSASPALPPVASAAKPAPSFNAKPVSGAATGNKTSPPAAVKK